MLRSTRHRPLHYCKANNRAWRDGNLKLVSRHDGPWELYDLSTDRAEQLNLAREEPLRVSSLITAYLAWAADNGVQPWPLLGVK